MAIEVFNRHEYKYLLTSEQFAKAMELLNEHMNPDPYNKDGRSYTISNIYYDTPNDDIIRHSISKPLYKEKLRLRSYGVAKGGDRVFLEIKKKYKGIVNKRRTEIELNDAYDFVAGKPLEIKDYMNSQVEKEIEYLLSVRSLVPKVYIAYDRIAFFDKEDGSLRVSFDTNIRTRRHDLRLENDGDTKPLLDGDYWVMEIKDRYSMPLWLAHFLSENGIKKQSFSKYGTEYRQYLGEEKNYA